MTFDNVFPAPFSIGTEVLFVADFTVRQDVGDYVIKAGVRAKIFGTGPDGMLFVETKFGTVVKVPGTFAGIEAI